MSKIVGTQFYAIDFHVHTIASSDYKDKKAEPEQIVSAALNAGLSAIVITDHNTLVGIETIQKAAAGSTLIIFPGFEINAQGGHVIGIFDPDTDINIIETALIEAGIGKHQWGNENVIGNSFTVVLSVITKYDGLAIAAHADGPKGFLTTINQGLTTIKIYKDSNLAALELTTLDKVEQYVEGKLSGYDRKIPCVQGSDAHSLDGIGTKHTLLRMHRLSLDGIRQAFAEPKLRIKFPSQWEPNKYPYIASMQVDQGFLSGHFFEFNPNLNCLIGGAGSGKSTIIEFIRFALDQVSGMEDFSDDCFGKLKDLALDGATIETVIVSESGERYSVSRLFNDEDNPITIKRISDGQIQDNVDLKKLFPIHAYSQGEALKIARNPLAQLELIDKHLDLNRYQEEIDDAYRELSEQSSGLAKLNAKVRDRQSVERSLATTKTQINSLTLELEGLLETKKNPVVKSHQLWIAEKNSLSELINQSFVNVKQEIEEKLDDINLSSLNIPIIEDAPNHDLLEECRKIVLKVEDARKKSKNDLLAELNSVEDQIRSIAQSWKEHYSIHDAGYQQFRVKLGESRIGQINAQLEKLRGDQHRYQTQLQQIEAAEKTLNNMLEKREKLLELIRDRRARIFTLRVKKAKDIVRKIGDTISLAVIHNGNKELFEETITELLKGRYAQREMIKKLCNSISPQRLIKLLREEDTSEIDRLSQIGEKWAITILEQVKAKPEFIYNLEITPLEDLLGISFKLEPGKYRELAKLSTGQKATVIVLLTMVEGKQPIIFDQPEDALYTPFIYTEVVKTLKGEKDKRQFILATHNPNISVAADMDLGIVLEGSSTQTTVKAVGGLEDKDTQELMIWHLEGGEDAFLTRQRKYGKVINPRIAS